jgi:hypothetical protein
MAKEPAERDDSHDDSYIPDPGSLSSVQTRLKTPVCPKKLTA